MSKNKGIKTGDNLAWSNPASKDHHWKNQRPLNNKYWQRFEVDFNEQTDNFKHKGLQLFVFGAYEAYWDGVLIDKNGHLGNNRAEEKAGTFVRHILVPDSLSSRGKHVLALRITQNYYTGRLWQSAVFVGEYIHFVRRDLKITAFMFFLAGAYLITAIYSLLLFINQKNDFSKLICSLMCFSFLGLILMEYLKFYYAYPYYFQWYRLLTIGLLTLLIAFLVPLFLSLYFQVPYKGYLMGAYFLALCFIAVNYRLTSDFTTQVTSLVVYITSLCIVIYAVFARLRDSWTMLLVLVSIGLFNQFLSYNFGNVLYDYDINLFLSFTLLVLATLYLIAKKTKEQRQAYDASLLRSARLQNELLKKHIQPHFIMNTLTSVMEWIEVSPRKSIEFIEALAGEFDILNDIADQQLIPISQEIDLCKKHLAVMGYRKEIKYVWEDKGVDIHETIPPAILHTIVENGMSHNIPRPEGAFTFQLCYEASAKQKRYTLRTIARIKSPKKTEREGTGFKYIRSRLRESYGDAWTLESKLIPEGWETSIVIFKN
ncbi:hypothetical protein BKI52_11200 [marine bacterium AO1-C]|nr:hypothetical protein BKI52_11200 [marine bacterium AO1-C]